MLRHGLFCLLSLTLALPIRAADPPCKDNPTIRATVVVVLASKTNSEIHPKLKELAEEMKKHDVAEFKEFKGFKLDTVHQKSIKPGDTHKFEILDDQKVSVKIEKGKDKVDLTITPPGMDAISYTCVCDKFFPVVTKHKTKTGETMIIAVSVKPCTGKGP